MHPSTSNILQFFDESLPSNLLGVNRSFYHLAKHIANEYEGPEVTACLRKLLEAKDCAVRAALTTTKKGPQTLDELREQAERAGGEGSITRKMTDQGLSETQQRDFNSAQAELTRLRQERHMELEEQAKRDPSGTDDPVEMTKEGPRNIGEITGELSKREVTQPRPKVRPVNLDDEGDFDD